MKITSGRQVRSPRLYVYGVPGSGKSTLASKAAKPLFIDLDNGTGNIECDRASAPDSFDGLLSLVEHVSSETHDYRTLVLDGMDTAEVLVWKVVVAAYNKTTKGQKVEGALDIGYGRGMDAAVDQWRRLVSRLEDVWIKRGMTVILIDHSAIRSFKDPAQIADYSRIEPKVDRKAFGLFRSWCDAVLYADFRIDVMVDDKTHRGRGIGGGTRVLRTEWRAAYEAKNRYGLPEEMAMDWRTLASGIAAGMNGAKQPAQAVENPEQSHKQQEVTS